MGKLILCRNIEVKQPLYIDELDIRLYSPEELCYYICHYALLIDEEFINDKLYHFIGRECEMPELAEKIKRWRDENAELTQILLMILQDIHYYEDRELRSFQEECIQIRSARPWERLKGKGDYMLQHNRLQSALRLYDTILAQAEKQKIPKDFIGLVYHNKAVTYTGLYSFNEAADSFKQAYTYRPSENTLKQLYHLYLLDEMLNVDNEIFEDASAEDQYKWKEEFEVLKKHAAHSEKALKARAICEKDSFRRIKEIDELLLDWKLEYRNLVR